MSMMDTIRSLIRCDQDHEPPITPVLCRRRNGERFFREEIHALVLAPERDDDRRTVHFYPGVTGHESYYLDSMLEELERSKREFVPELGVFGMTRWEHTDWCICAGGVVYDELTASVGDLAEALMRLGVEIDLSED